MQKMALVAIFKAHAHAHALAEKTAVSGGNGHGSRGAKQTRSTNKALINGLILTRCYADRPSLQKPETVVCTAPAATH